MFFPFRHTLYLLALCPKLRCSCGLNGLVSTSRSEFVGTGVAIISVNPFSGVIVKLANRNAISGAHSVFSRNLCVKLIFTFSISGLVIFITSELHRSGLSDLGIAHISHNNPVLNYQQILLTFFIMKNVDYF